MNVFVACEFSGKVRNAFRAKGHDAWSCDLIASLDNSPFHLIGDVRTFLSDSRAHKWIDLLIVFPPCDRLLVAGALHWKKWQESGEQAKGIEFFLFFTKLPIKRICIENPTGIMSTIWQQPTQRIQPYEFGHMETKNTGLWLKNLPPLRATNNVYTEMMKLPKAQRERIHYASPGIKNGLTRSQRRAIFFPGWADAMSDQWGSLVL